ncbi:MAG: beta strand repeat-containing protein [Limnohabitans sp.]
MSVADGAYQSVANSVNGYGNSIVQAYSGNGGSYAPSATTTGTFGNEAITLSNGNVVTIEQALNTSSNYVVTTTLMDTNGQVLSSTTKSYVAGTMGSYGGDQYGDAVALRNPSTGAMDWYGHVYAHRYGANSNYDYRMTVFNDAGVEQKDLLLATWTPPSMDDAISVASFGANKILVMHADNNASAANVKIDVIDYSGTTGAVTNKATLATNYGFSTRGFELVALNNNVNGHAYVAIWMDGTTSANGTNFKYQFLDSTGAPAGSVMTQTALVTSGQISTQLNDTGVGAGYHATATNDGGFAMTWSTTTSGAGYNLNFAKVSASGGFSAVKALDTNRQTNWGGEVVELVNGQLLVAWTDNGPSGSVVQTPVYQVLNADGSLAGVPVVVTDAAIATSITLGGSHTIGLAALDGGGAVLFNRTKQVLINSASSSSSSTGTSGSETLMGGEGADTLTGGGGADVILAGAGNDTVVVNASNIGNLTTTGKLLDGGTGVDTLRISADASTLDLSKSTVQANVQGFEKIDLGSNATVNTLILNATAVQRLASQNLDGGASTNKQLIIDGSSSDLVKLSGQYNNGVSAGTWAQSTSTPTRVVGGITYKVYTISGLAGVEVLVNNAITTANTDLAYAMAAGDLVTLPSSVDIVGDLESTATGGSTGTGDGGSQQPSTLSSTTTDTTPLVRGTLSQALSGTQVLKLYRTNVTDNTAAVEVSANVTTSGTTWQFQDSGLTAGKQYRYEARIMDGTTTVDASNTYTINLSATPSDTTAPTLAITDAQPAIASNGENVVFTFTFNEPVSGFDASDVAVTNGTKLSGTFTPVGTATVVNGVAYYSTYQMTVTTPASGSGTVAVSVAAGAYTDTAGNSGNAATATQQYGTTIPGGLVPASQVVMSPAVGEYSHSLELSNGNYVWGSGQYSYGNSNVINGSIRVLDSAGAVVSTFTIPTQITTAAGYVPTVGGMNTVSFAANPTGFAVAYRLNANIYLALYNNSGVLQNTGTVATPVVTTLGSATGGNVGGIHALTYSPDTGNYVVAYVGSDGIYTREVQANSTALGTATRVSDTLTSISAYGGIDISTLANGDLAVSWNQTPGTEGVMTRVLDKQGVPLSGSTVLTSFTSLTAYESLQVESVSAQNFVVVGASTPVNNSSAYGVITAVLYQNDGTLVRTSTVSTENTGTNSHPRMAVLDNGNLVIVYQHTPAAQGAGSDIRFQLFDASLNKIGGEQTVLNTTDKDWSFAGSDATVTATEGGGFVLGVGGSKNPDAGSAGTSTSGAMFFGIDSFQAFYDASGTPLSQSGTTGADNLFGRDGNDTLHGAGGADKIYAGAGDDTVVLNASNVTQLSASGSGALVDGGTGINLLKLDTSAAASITLDLTLATVGSQLGNFQKFDITGNGANILKLNVSDVLASNMVVGAKSHVVQIDGDSNDTVNLTHLLDNGSQPGTWSTTSTTVIGGVTYNVYNYSGDASLQVLIDSAITTINHGP